MFGTTRKLTDRRLIEYPLGHPPDRMTLHSVRGPDPRTIEFRRSGGPEAEPTIVVNDRGDFRELVQEYVLHSPTGLEFGYGGSGPGDCALNVLSLVVSPREAWRLHQDFKAEHIATIPREGGTLTLRTVRDWIAARYESELADVERMTDEREMRELLDEIEREVTAEGAQ